MQTHTFKIRNLFAHFPVQYSVKEQSNLVKPSPRVEASKALDEEGHEDEQRLFDILPSKGTIPPGETFEVSVRLTSY